MSVNKRIGLGFTLSVDPLGGTAYTTIGAIVDGFSESEAKAMMVETAILTDVYITKSKSQVDPGEVTYTIAYDPDETSSVLLNQLLAYVSQVAPAWLITFPAGVLGNGTITTKGFYAHLSGMGREIKKDGMVTCPITLTKSGNPGF